MNQWIEIYLRQFVNGQQNNWSTLLPVAEFAHNSWRNQTTQKTPHQLLIGMDPASQFTPSDGTVPASETRLQELINSRQLAQELITAHARPSPPIPSFSIGQLVYLDGWNLKKQTPSKKLSAKWEGPFKILQQTSPVNYRLELPRTWNIHPVFHVDLLAPHNFTEAYGLAYPRPPPDIIDDEEEYEVKEIIFNRVKQVGQKCTP